MKSIQFLLIAFSILLLTSCFKNQLTSNKLNGEWSIQSWYEAGSSVNVNGTIEFNDCKVRKDNCDGWTRYSRYGDEPGSVAAKFDYTIEAKDKKLEMTYSFVSGTQVYDVDYELDGSDLSLEYFDEDNDFVRIELQK